MELALMVEDKMQLGSNYKRDWRLDSSPSGKINLGSGHSSHSNHNTLSTYSSLTKSNPSYAASTLTAGSSPLLVAKHVGEIRRLSEKELQFKREKGLCYRCDDKWTVGHRCRCKELSVLLT